MFTRKSVMYLICSFLILGIIGCTSSSSGKSAASEPPKPNNSPATETDPSQLRISGPYIDQNLAVYFIHSDQRDESNYLMLDEAIQKKVLKISEKENEPSLPVITKASFSSTATYEIIFG